MNKKQLDILEKAFSAQVDSAMKQDIASAQNNPFGIIQTKSKVAKQLCDDGYLEYTQVNFGRHGLPVTIKGYILTIKGNLAYCTSDRCKLDEDKQND